MQRVMPALERLAVALWAGGLWVIGFLAAPLLFRSAPDRQIAGDLAGVLFTGMAFVGLACAAIILCARIAEVGTRALKQGAFWLAIAMLALTLGGQFGVQPILAGLKEQALPRQVMESIFRDRFATWHGVASALYVIESVLAAGLVLVSGRRTR